MLTPKSVIETYELILGRQPESNDVVNHHVKNTPAIDYLEKSLICSEEFFQKMRADEDLQKAVVQGIKSSGRRQSVNGHSKGDPLWSRLGRRA